MFQRKKDNLTLRGLASLTGVSAATLNRIENGNNIDIDTFCKILDYLGKKPKAYIK